MIFKKNKNYLIRSIGKLKYPFLEPVSSFSKEHKLPLITKINELAKTAYSRSNNDTNTLSFGELVSQVEKDPFSWLICSNKSGEILGYIHVELTSSEHINELVKGKISENELPSILKGNDNNTVIHIGSVIANNYPLPLSDTTPIQLIAGVVDRILTLRESNTFIDTIIACDFEDFSGDRHFEDILPRYGFSSIGTTVDGNTIYQINLESMERPFSKIVEVVADSRLKFLIKKNKKSLIGKFIKSLPSGLKDINEVLLETNKVKKLLLDITNDS